MFGRIDHIGVAVSDLDAAIELHTSAYGMELVHREVVESQGVEAVLLDVGENHVELLAPLGDQTPVGKFALAGLREAGVRLIDEQPRNGIRSSRVAFLHPGASGGVLTELVEPAEVHA